MLKFSIIIPVFNSENYVKDCLQSVLYQQNGNYDYEIIVVDDCSTDSTFSLLQKMEKKYSPKIKILQTKHNSGPGIARNVALQESEGDWVLFLDSDDRLIQNALIKLSNYILANTKEQFDAIGFDWIYPLQPNLQGNNNGERKDFISLRKKKNELIEDYISLKMDGSVIYTLIRNKLIRKNKIKFHRGYHEDVDFIFKVYWYAKNIGCLEVPLYLKNNRIGSIVNTISEHHIEGFFRAYREILHFFKEQNSCSLKDFKKSFHIGLAGVLATRVREIYSKKIPDKDAELLFNRLYNEWKNISNFFDDFSIPKLKTKYGLIANKFLEIMRSNEDVKESKVLLIDEFMTDIIKKTWSCYDLHNSIFLTPGDIRTCCKRFFVNGDMRGDVALLNIKDSESSSFDTDTIFEAKKTLHNKINCGDDTECDDCPFLEFKDWGQINSLNIEHISFEYHSVCNMKCIYCSDTYYGGEKAKYDVIGLVEDLILKGSLNNCKSVVWGGGEPVVDKSFVPLIDLISFNFPKVKQRLLTNCIKYSEKVNSLLLEDKITITTSIDAGTPETFFDVRGSSKFNDVFKHLKEYAASNLANVTIKYIFIEDKNTDLEEIKAFVKLVEKYELSGCNFQISYDFKSEAVNNNSIISTIVLYGLLIWLGCRLVFFDDLLRQRFVSLSDDSEKFIRARLKKFGLPNILANKNNYKKIVIWGAGWQAKTLIENSCFFKDVQVEYFVDDSTPSKVGSKFLGYDVLDPSALLSSDSPVLISAVQGFSTIYDSYLRLGLDESRLIKELVI